MIERVKNYFNQVADSYEHLDNPTIDILLQSLNISKGMRVLDLACGKGIISNRISQLCQNDVIALDISEKMIAEAKRNVDNDQIHFINDDYYHYNDKPFDMIICFDAFPHFLNVDDFVNKSFELLKEDGILAILHDCGRDELNSHHKAHAMGVSRPLREPNEEVKAFLKNFKIIEIEESDSFYKIILKKSK